MSLREAAQDLFEVLISRPFLVIDTEYTTGPEGSHLISIALVPVIGGRRAPAGDELYLEMNPGVPIDTASSAIHGFTDAGVARKQRFAHHAPRILAALAVPDAVLVSHTGVDIHLLRTELERLDEARAAGDRTIQVGRADLPDLPLIDTSTLPRLVALPDVGNRATIGLARLCHLTGVTNKRPHHARYDARATADVLTKVLLHAAGTFSWSTLDELLREHNRGTTLEPHISRPVVFPGLSEPRLPVEHMALHTRPLLDPASDAELARFVDLAAACVRLRCRHLLEAVDLAAPHNGPSLLEPLHRLLPGLTEPGQAGTLLGALLRLLDPVDEDAAPALPSTSAMTWWGRRKDAVHASTACSTTGADACPDCRDGNGCPRDRLYQPLARLATLGERGELTSDSIKDRLLSPTKTSGYRALTKWRDQQAVAYMAWMVVSWFLDAGYPRTAHDHLGLARARGLELIEPRLALIACETESLHGDPGAARTTAAAALVNRTTDPGWNELAAWLAWHEHSLEHRARASAPRIISHPRLARPAGRVNPNPYLP